MTKCAGWLAALGGVVALMGQYVSGINSWAVPLGAIVAIIFGAMAAMK